MSKTVKISEESYSTLSRIAGKLRTLRSAPASLEETFSLIIHRSVTSPLNFAGAWALSDEEKTEMESDLDQLWDSWKLQS